MRRGRDGVMERNDGMADARVPMGIVIRATTETEQKPRIAAFIWGGKVRPEPTLPYGRWK